MRIIGIDPGTICCGYGIVEYNTEFLYISSGQIQMSRKDDLPERLKVLYNSLKAIMNEYKPSHLCLEKIFYHKSIRSAFALGSTRGIAMLLAAENNIPVFEYNPTEIKMALTGYGRAEKRQVKEMVVRVLNLRAQSTEQTIQTFSEDTTDALALCICHANMTNGGKVTHRLK